MDDIENQGELATKSVNYAMSMPSFEDYMQLKSQNRNLRKIIEDLKVSFFTLEYFFIRVSQVRQKWQQ